MTQRCATYSVRVHAPTPTAAARTRAERAASPRHPRQTMRRIDVESARRDEVRRPTRRIDVESARTGCQQRPRPGPASGDAAPALEFGCRGWPRRHGAAGPRAGRLPAPSGHGERHRIPSQAGHRRRAADLRNCLMSAPTQKCAPRPSRRAPDGVVSGDGCERLLPRRDHLPRDRVHRRRVHRGHDDPARRPDARRGPSRRSSTISSSVPSRSRHRWHRCPA